MSVNNYQDIIKNLRKGDVLKYPDNVKGTNKIRDHFLVFDSYKDCKVYGSISNIGNWDGLLIDGLLRNDFKIYSWKDDKFIKKPKGLTKERLCKLISHLTSGDLIGYSFEGNNISTLIFDSLGEDLVKGKILKSKPENDKSIFDFRSLDFKVCKW
ncbi:MAG: hypothetical protein WC812_00630 [Candidatus Pacearchaeota archaeon]|jgi:predicted amidohydrolase